MLFFAILAHFWPVFGLLRPRYLFQKHPMSIFVLVLTGLKEIGEIIMNNYELFDKIADFGHFSLFLACFGLDICIKSSQ